MSKSKSRSRSRSHSRKQAAEVAAPAPEPEHLNLRTAPPVKRVMGKISAALASLTRDHEKLEGWGETNVLAKEAAEQLAAILNEFPALTEQLNTLDASGFSPPRLSYTASVAEGDRVSVLEEHRHLYDDIMPAELMLDLLVLKKQPGKGGGLVVENSKGSRMRVAVSHTVKK
jgi:hypothetical protein